MVVQVGRQMLTSQVLPALSYSQYPLGADLKCTALCIFTYVYTHVTYTQIKIQNISGTQKAPSCSLPLCTPHRWQLIWPCPQWFWSSCKWTHTAWVLWFWLLLCTFCLWDSPICLSVAEVHSSKTGTASIVQMYHNFFTSCTTAGHCDFSSGVYSFAYPVLDMRVPAPSAITRSRIAGSQGVCKCLPIVSTS